MARLIKPQTRKAQHSRGIASLEFVLILPLLLGLIFATMEAGWMVSKYGELVNAAREGAREGARVDGTNADINAVVDQRMADAGMSGYTTTITNAADVGDPVTVNVSVPYGNVELIGSFLIPLNLSDNTLQASVSMAKEGT